MVTRKQTIACMKSSAVWNYKRQYIPERITELKPSHLRMSLGVDIE
jgi:hypothetical protein